MKQEFNGEKISSSQTTIEIKLKVNEKIDLLEIQIKSILIRNY